MLTENEKKIIRMMVINTTPDYMAEVGALSDEEVRVRIEEFRENRLVEINQGLAFHNEQLFNAQVEIDRLNTLKTELETL